MAKGVRFQRSEALILEPDPTAPDWDSWGEWTASQSRPLAVDLFAGGGGLSLGLENAGFRVGLAADHDPWSVQTHAANFRGLSVGLDLSDQDEERRLTELLSGADVALIAGGPPCQPFSRAGRSAIRFLVEQGKRAAYDDRRDLWRVWLRIVLAVRPQAVLLENVPDMALGDDLAVVRVIVDALQEVGYETHLDIVQAPHYGVPQHRQRLILVALRDQRQPFVWPTPVDRVSIWDAISDLPALGEGTGGDVLPYRRRKRTPFQQRARAGVAPKDRGVVYDHVTRAVRDDDRLAFRLMKPNTRYSDLPEELRRYRADTFDDKYKRHGKDELARSITAHIAKDGYWYIHPVEERTLSVREAARLQTFPDWYRFAGNRTHAYRQIGNAVPPLLAEHIGRSILAALADEPAPNISTPVPRHFPAEMLRESRHLLDVWAERDARVAPWRHRTDPWTALMSTVLSTGRADDGTVAMLVWQVPTPGHLEDSGVLDDRALPAGVRRSLARLLPAVSAWRNRHDSAVGGGGDTSGETPWWEAVVLQPAEAERFACIALGAPVLLTTQAPMRVAARVTGRPVDKVDRLTDGRLALAEIIGGGDRAAARMAAVAAVGRGVCTVEEPDCRSCPLSLLCRASAY
ncbi:DNA cytosine methyltransferase [uncultured Friedmanniella sp.]|uniref:DNA cytosine methyltransferase n=1 Tax=uncultured Friedmanniella sp. TaxID=335381 RepID=UPI0035CAF3FA